MLQYKTYRIKHDPIRVWRWSYPDDIGNKLLVDIVQEAWKNGINISEVNNETIVQKAARFEANYCSGSNRVLLYDKYIWFFVRGANGRKTLVGLSKLTHGQQNSIAEMNLNKMTNEELAVVNE